MYERTTLTLIKILGVEHRSSAIDIRFLLELYCRVSMQDNFNTLLNFIDQRFDVATPSRKEDILQSMRATPSHLYWAKMFQPALEVLKWTWQRGEPVVVAAGYLSWRLQVMDEFHEICAAIGNTKMTEEYGKKANRMRISIKGNQVESQFDTAIKGI